jgi:hypothetical protein
MVVPGVGVPVALKGYAAEGVPEADIVRLGNVPVILTFAPAVRLSVEVITPVDIEIPAPGVYK